MVKTNFSLSPKEFLKQELLSNEKLQKLSPKKTISLKNLDRPGSGLLKLINWTKDNFLISDLENTVYFHNDLMINGSFFLFAEENKIKIETLHKDMVLSYSSVFDAELEKFQVQGVFKINCAGFSFLLVSTFIQGPSGEEELISFVIVNNDDFEKYQALRQTYKKWVEHRENLSSTITVVGGDSVYFERDYSWNDLFLEQETKNEIKNMIEFFLNNKEFYLQNKIPWKKGLLLWGDPGNGKTSIIKTIISNFNFKPITIVPEADNDTIREAFLFAEDHAPALLYIEDLDSLFANKNIDVSLFLNLMDGVVSKNGLFVIATANDLSGFKNNITQRPSRFDRVMKINSPNEQMCNVYLKKWFDQNLTDEKIAILAKKCFEYKFSFAYLKELYILSMFEAISNNRKKPINKDIDISLNRLVKDKNLNKQMKVNLDSYKS